ncbi:MAG: hypothetical protein QM790_01635 [Nibricoccus sp.]
MPQKQQVEFALTAKIGDTPVSPEHVLWGQMRKFQDEVQQLILGSNKSSLDAAVVTVKHGSYGLLLPIPEEVEESFNNDMAAANSEAAEVEADPKRFEILRKWQRRAVMEGHVYDIRPRSTATRLQAFKITEDTVIKRTKEDVWIPTEATLLGRIVNAGGEDANIHVRLRDNPKPVIVWVDSELLEREAYPFSGEKLLRVTAERNGRTGELRNYRLIAFVRYTPAYDETAFQKMLAAGAEAWSDVNDPVAWVREQRGGEE